MKKPCYITAAVLAVLTMAPLLLAACGSAVLATVDDATVTTRVKTVLINAPSLEPQRIDVDTFKGVVTLKGRVRSKEEEATVIALARSVKGVTDVKSELQIQP